AEPYPARDLSQSHCRDDARATFGEETFVELRMAAEQMHRDRLTQNRVAQELETLVVRDAAVLVRVGAVRQRKRQQLGVDVCPEAGGEHRVLSVDVPHVVTVVQTSATLRPLYSRSSSVPCESVTTFAWCGRLYTTLPFSTVLT